MIKDPLEVEVQLENVALKDPKVLLERLVKWDLLEAVLKLEHVVKKGDTGGVGQRQVVRVQEVHKVLMDYVELLVSKVLLECKDLLVLLLDKANVA